MSTSNDSPLRRSECPISFGLDLFGDKWTLLILRDILLFKKARFSDFAVHEGIATNILSNRLNRLEKAGVITKQRDENLKNQNTYHATKKGQDLVPVLATMMAWGLQHDAQTPVSKAFVSRLKSEYKQVIKETTHAIKDGTFEAYRQKQMGVNSDLYTQ